MKIAPTIICKTKQNKKKMIPGLNTSSSLTTHSNKQTHSLSLSLSTCSCFRSGCWQTDTILGNFPTWKPTFSVLFWSCQQGEVTAGKSESRLSPSDSLILCGRSFFPRHGLADVSATFNTHTREPARRGRPCELRRTSAATPGLLQLRLSRLHWGISFLIFLIL